MSTRVFLGVHRKKTGYGMYSDTTDFTLRFEKAGDYGNDYDEIATVRHLSAGDLTDLRALIDGLLPQDRPYPKPLFEHND